MSTYGHNPENRAGIRELKQAGNFLNHLLGIVALIVSFLFSYPERSLGPEARTQPLFQTHTQQQPKTRHTTMRPVACSPPSSPRPSASSSNTTTRAIYGSQGSSSSPMSSPIPSTVSAYLGDEDLTSLSDDFASLYAK